MTLGSRSSGDDEPEDAAAGAAEVVAGPVATLVPLMAGEGPETCPAARAASAQRTRYRQAVLIAPLRAWIACGQKNSLRRRVISKDCLTNEARNSVGL